jgi:S-adenosyl-L-methionine hydrolase (adenosine-forming)
LARLITFSSDYGPTDEFVGVCHLVIARIAPDVRVVDGAHGIRSVRGGSTVLAQSLPEAPDDAVHLAVVDPGVGTERRPVAIAVGNGSFLVGPDNGVFFPVADRLGGALAAYQLSEMWFRREPLSSTFHGRDIFAPAAAHLALGVPVEEFGPAVAPSDLVRLGPPFVRAEHGVLEAEVVRTDWFGNLQTAAMAADFAISGLDGRIDVNGYPATVGEKFADVGEGELLVYVNSADHVAVACNGGSARELLQDPERVTLNGKT